MKPESQLRRNQPNGTTSWRICEVNSRRREIVNKKVPEPRMREPLANTLKEATNEEGKVDQPSLLKGQPSRPKDG